jgi:hypothetical protein
LKSIGPSAFSYSSLHSIAIPDSVEFMGQSCFASCSSLQEVLFGSSSRLTLIPPRTFAETGIREIWIPKSIRVIETDIFKSSSYLPRLTFEPFSCLEVINNPLDGVRLWSLILPSSVETLIFKRTKPNITLFESASALFRTIDSAIYDLTGRKLICRCGLCADLVIPPWVDILGSYCFVHSASFDQVTFAHHSHIERIEEGAFAHTRLKRIQIPKTVKSLGQTCFAFCRELTKVYVEAFSVLHAIDNGAFQRTSLVKFSLPATVEMIADLRFADYRKFSVLSITTDSQLRRIGTNPFSGTKLTHLELPVHVQFIDGTITNKAALNCSVDSRSKLLQLVDNGLSSFDPRVFIRHFGGHCQYVVPQYVRILGKYCFAHCDSLDIITFAPNSATRTIEEAAFAYLRLRSIILPKSLVLIGEFALFQCSELQEVTFESKSQLQYIKEKAFRGTKIHRILLPRSLQTCGSHAFSVKSLSDLSFERFSNLVVIGEGAFRESRLEKVEIPARVEVLGESCFERCTMLCEVFFEAGSLLHVIQRNAFKNTRLTHVILPASLIELGECCFASNSLTRIEIEANPNLGKIADGAFRKSNVRLFVIPTKTPAQVSFSDPGCEIRVVRSGLFPIVKPNYTPLSPPPNGVHRMVASRERSRAVWLPRIPGPRHRRKTFI